MYRLGMAWGQNVALKRIYFCPFSVCPSQILPVEGSVERHEQTWRPSRKSLDFNIFLYLFVYLSRCPGQETLCRCLLFRVDSQRRSLKLSAIFKYLCSLLRHFPDSLDHRLSPAPTLFSGTPPFVALGNTFASSRKTYGNMHKTNAGDAKNSSVRIRMRILRMSLKRNPDC